MRNKSTESFKTEYERAAKDGLITFSMAIQGNEKK
jgi:hypothetical protein